MVRGAVATSQSLVWVPSSLVSTALGRTLGSSSWSNRPETLRAPSGERCAAARRPNQSESTVKASTAAQ